MNFAQRDELRAQYHAEYCNLEALRCQKRTKKNCELLNASDSRLGTINALLKGTFEWASIEEICADVEECSMLGVDGRSVEDHLASIELSYVRLSQGIHRLKVGNEWSPAVPVNELIVFDGHTVELDENNEPFFGTIIPYPVTKVNFMRKGGSKKS